MKEYTEYLKSLEVDKSNNTIIAYKNAIDKFIKYFKVETIEDLTKLGLKEIRQYRDQIVSDGMKTSTANSHHRYVNVFFNWLLNSEYIIKNPFSKLKYLKNEEKLRIFLTQEEVQQVLSSCRNKQDRMIVAFFVSLGIRREELINIKMNDITDDMILIHGKGNKQRNVIMPPDVYNLYQDFLGWREWNNKKMDFVTDYLFVSKNRKFFSKAAISLKIKTLCKQSGLSKERVAQISPHKLRHTYAVNMVERGINMMIIKESMGHEDMATTQIYADVSQRALREAMVSQRAIV